MYKPREVAKAKRHRAKQLDGEYERQLSDLIPDSAKHEYIEVIYFIMQNIAPAARDPGPKLTQIYTLRGKYKQAITDIKALETVPDVEAFDVVAALA